MCQYRYARTWSCAKIIGLYALCAVGIISNQIVISHGNPCISFQNEYEHTNVCSSSSTWAVDLPALTVSHVIYTNDPSYPIAYYLVLKNAPPIPLCKIVGCEMTGSNCISCESNQIGRSNGSINTTFNITNLGSDKDGCNLTYDFQSEGIARKTIHSFSISACNTTENRKTTDQNSSYTITATDEGNYDSIGKCTCNKPEEILYEVDGTNSSGTVKCGYSAEWKGCDKVQCWSGPKISSVEQINYDVNDSDPFKCNFEEGFPLSTKTAFQINGMGISDDYILKSDDHGKKFSCEVISNYTISENKPVKSNDKTIKVYFSPEKATLSPNSIVIKINDTQSIEYSVYANPRDQDNITITLNKTSNGSSASFMTIHHYDNYLEIARHTYIVNITITSVEDYGNYKMCAETKNPNGSDCDDLEICNTAEPTTSKPDATTSFSFATDAKPVKTGISAAIIAAIVVGGVILVLIVVIFFLCKKRRKASNIDGSKEVKNNELYGSTQYQIPSVENPESIRQETPNVLYVPASGGASGDVVECEYAVTQPDVAEEDKVLFTTSAAEQPSSSGSAVYAQINKKKGNLNDGFQVEAQDSEPGTSGATYTVVDKTKKRNKDDVPEVYAVVNKPRTKG